MCLLEIAISLRACCSASGDGLRLACGHVEAGLEPGALDRVGQLFQGIAAGRVPRWICRWFTSSAAADGFIRAARSCVANDTAFHVRRDRSRRLGVCIYLWGRTHAEAEPHGPLLEAVRHCYPRLLVESAEYPI